MQQTPEQMEAWDWGKGKGMRVSLSKSRTSLLNKGTAQSTGKLGKVEGHLETSTGLVWVVDHGWSMGASD